MRRDDEVSRLEAAVRNANPVPCTGDVRDSDEAAAVTLLVEQRRRTMTTTPTQTAPQPTGRPPRRRRPIVWAFAAGFIVTLLMVGAAVLFLGGDDLPVADEPAIPATPVEEPHDLINVDSLTWSRINLGMEGPGLHISAGGPGLVAVGVYHQPDPNDLADGGGGPGWVQGYLDLTTVWTSPDGYEWSRVPDSEAALGSDIEIADIAGGNDVLVAVAENYAWTSPDGITWTPVPDGTFQYNVDRLRGVISGGPGFVVFGEDETSNNAVIWTSPDGYAWTQVPNDPAVFNASIHAMTVGGPGLVAVGFDEATSNPVVWTSPDGYSWTRLPHDPAVFGDGDPWFFCGGSTCARDVSTGGPGLVAVGYDNFMEQAAVWTSPDGVAWTRVPDDPAVFGAPPGMPDSEMTSVAAIGDGLIAIGWRGGEAAVWTSHDGFAWTDITDHFDLTDNAGMVEVIAGGPGAVILGEVLIEDYRGNRPPQIETVMWIGSPSEPTG